MKTRREITKERALDRLSYPLRKALMEWANKRHCGYGGGWSEADRYWRYYISLPIQIEVIVTEDGSEANVLGETIEDGGRWGMSAKTVRGLKTALTLISTKEKTNGQG